MSEKQDFLVEIGVEELPPKSLLTLARAFEKSISDQLANLRLEYGDVKRYATPRRLAVVVADLDSQQPSQEIETLGPAVKAAFDDNGQPTPAAMGFARKLGLEVADLAEIDTDKGPRLGYKKTEVGAATVDLLESVVETALDSLPIAKRMRWGSRRDEFVRPVHWVTMLFGSTGVDASLMGLPAGTTTRGHRFHADKAIQVSQPSAYEDLLEAEGKVIADCEKRRDLVNAAVNKVAEAASARAVVESDLLDEVTALVEWPVALMGNFDERFLDVPSEALISSMKEHQKYFHVVDAQDQLLPHFITVSNIESKDPNVVVDGNERVIRPRLADAAFFYETDLKTDFASFRERLKPIVFQTKLGTVYEKTERIARLAEGLAQLTGADKSDCRRAGELCKNDLVSEMVGEFSDLQGLMGSYYAKASGENAEVAASMSEHYQPKFAGDDLPATATGKAVALADRLDTLTGIFGIGQIPTGSKDPFALRRASLGVLRILVETEINSSLKSLLEQAHSQHKDLSEESVEKLLEYMIDRFGAWFEDMGVPAESFHAVRALEIDDPFDIYSRTLAVTEFSKSADATALAGANKRVSNILSKGDLTQQPVNESLLIESAEKALFEALTNAESEIKPLLDATDYSAALSKLSKLRAPIDSFFDDVMVMTDDVALRENRLALLNMLRRMFLSIADISLLPNEQ